MTAGVGGFGRTGPGVGADGKKFAVLRLAVRPERSLAASEAVSAELALVRVPAPLCAVAPFLPGAGLSHRQAGTITAGDRHGD